MQVFKPLLFSILLHGIVLGIGLGTKLSSQSKLNSKTIAVVLPILVPPTEFTDSNYDELSNSAATQKLTQERQTSPSSATDSIGTLDHTSIKTSWKLVQGSFAPKYPRVARKKGWSGRVVLNATINSKGEILGVSVKESSGHLVLDQSALDAIRRARFIVNGDPLRTNETYSHDIAFRFVLEE